ncbi:MAG: tetratricopeptide repeat protein [Bacteroidota bacterium]
MNKNKNKSKQVIKKIVQVPVKKKEKQFLLPYFSILIFSFILYGNTITNDYALDDSIVIVQNEFTKKGIDGIKDIMSYDTFTGFFGVQKKLVAGGRYRPFSLVTFAIEYEIFGENPHISHFINILLYAFTGMLIYSLLRKLLKKYNSNRKWYISIPFIATIIYLALPIHTEVVANIKGRDEILTFLGALLAMYYSIRYLATDKMKYLIFNFVVFFFALLSKENAITFVAIIPLTIYFFTDYKLSKNFVTVIPLLIATGIFLIIRQKVLGHPEVISTDELMNNPFINSTRGEEIATVLFTWLIYLKLLVYPFPLTFDYYPKHIEIMSFSSPFVIASVIIFLVLIVIGLSGIMKKSLISYGILFFGISFSIVSNLLFNIGAFMNERFMYISSLGLTIVIAYIMVMIINKLIKNSRLSNVALAIVLILITGIYSSLSIARNPVWENDYVLFTHDVNVSFNSAKSTCSAGGKISEEAVNLREIRTKSNSVNEIIAKIDSTSNLPLPEREEFYAIENLEKLKSAIQEREDEMLKKSLEYLLKSVEIHPKYVDAWLLLGNVYFHYNKNFEKSAESYIRILKINPNYDRSFSNMEIVMNQCEDIDLKIKIWEQVFTINSNRFEPNYQLGNLYGRFKNDPLKALPYLEKAAQIQPMNASAYKDLGVAYGLSQQYEKSIVALEKAVQFDPNDAQTFINLGVTYNLTGKPDQAIRCFTKAKEIDKNVQIPVL